MSEAAPSACFFELLPGSKTWFRRNNAANAKVVARQPGTTASAATPSGCAWPVSTTDNAVATTLARPMSLEWASGDLTCDPMATGTGV